MPADFGPDEHPGENTITITSSTVAALDPTRRNVFSSKCGRTSPEPLFILWRQCWITSTFDQAANTRGLLLTRWVRHRADAGARVNPSFPASAGVHVQEASSS